MGKVYTKYGVVIATALIIYFIVLKFIGLHQYPIFSALNGVFFGGGILLAMKKYKSQATSFKYQKGFQVGFMTGAVASVIFTILMAIYMYQLDTEFATRILDSWNLDYASGTFMVLVTIFIMGISTSLVLTLAFMQLLKTSWNTPDGNRNALK
tara:strand:- start:128720 stop:129178 length:459 start_codon:yes stop_codon:yes gene_type:complete